MWSDPRRVVVLVTALVLLLASSATAVLWSSLQQTGSSVHYLADSLEPPMEHLQLTEQANDAGQTALVAAASASGEERTALLSAAIAASQDIKVQWSKFKATAAGLPDERDLIRKYEADQRTAAATSAAALVPILNSAEPSALPASEIESYGVVSADLTALTALYQRAHRRSIGELAARQDRSEQRLVVAAAAGLLIVLAASVFAFRRAGRVADDRSRRQADAELAAFETRYRRALGLVDDEAAAFSVADRAIREVLPTGSVTSLLVADSSGATLTPVGPEPVCGVSTPEACPAMRSGTAVSFNDSAALDSCPTLAANSGKPCSATCVPVTVGGRTAAILNLVGPRGLQPERQGATDLVARGVGDRVTMLQALATFQLQAQRDPLTGLLNRRSLETAVEHVVAGGRDYAVAFGDLDHFKQLNDLYGHEAGDRALRAFSRTLRDSLRPEDIACRWGGEEFVVVLPGCGAAAAAEAMDRVRTNLVLGSIAGQSAVVTASFGVAESANGVTFEQVVELADAALHLAKDEGRDRVVIHDPTMVRAPIGDAFT